MYLDDPDIELLDDDFERMAPLLDVRVSELLTFRFDNPDTQIQLSWSTDEPLEFDTLPRPLRAWRDKFKNREAITAARKQGYRSIAITGHRLPFSVEKIWRHIDYAERMRSVVINSQEWMKSYLGVDIENQPLIVKALEVLPSLLVEDQYTPSMILGCSGPCARCSISSLLASSRVQASTAPDKVYGAFPSDLMAILVASGKHQPDSPQREVLDKYIFASPLVPYRTLADLRSFVRARPLSIWFLPLCFRDHWAMARVDVGQRTWTLFNSLSHIRIDEITRNSALALFDYLELHILNTEPKQGRMAQQADGSSCGPAAINVGETELLLVPPFSAGRAHIARICQYIRIIGGVQANSGIRFGIEPQIPSENEN
ncbi:BQ5605_C030g10888 [Microbotryum silenes-dioicae]|uniref:BQ5605_C030g10888 protein n=1 Tax=Microbotryum silenes-dioicae TaxID=796604 RepID=A0A2X0MKY5_9BASI|nr:BQ5605_C030g10888 [Microbotryum silenes-dioicae]